MDWLKELYTHLQIFVPSLVAIAFIVLGLWFARWLLLVRQKDLGEEKRFGRLLWMLLISAVAVVLILLVIPVDDTTRGQLLSLLGLLLTAVIALSSTTFVANAMAGTMLRIVKSFRPGDFVHVEQQFGRVTERGLFHTEIQTEDGDLATLPNLYLVSRPVTVVRSEQTIVSATVSLGYENQHELIESLLVQAAEKAGLKDPFVQVLELGDYSVNYRLAGVLEDVKQILTARSNLRKAMLDKLHGSGVEIVSPGFVNQRQYQQWDEVMPKAGVLSATSKVEPDQTPEAIIFDKAELAEKKESLRQEYTELKESLATMESEFKSSMEDQQKAQYEYRMADARSRLQEIDRTLKPAKEGAKQG